MGETGERALVCVGLRFVVARNDVETCNSEMASVSSTGLGEKMAKQRRKWTTKEVKLLKKNAGKIPASEIGRILGRPRKAVTTKAYQMRLPASTRRNAREFNLTEGQKGYVAGIIDGEGTISLNIFHDSRTHLLPKVIINNTNKKLMVTIHKLIGGTFSRHRRYEVTKRLIYRCELQKLADIKALLRLIKRYLVAKRRQARLMIEYCDSRLSHYEHPYTERELEISKLICGCNHYGKRKKC